jgi:protein-tyrosine phosphatase
MRDIEIDYDGDRFESYEPVLKRIAQSKGIEVQYHNFPIIDIYIPSKEQMREILDAINIAMYEKHQPVYVHCRGGIGRTGTVVGCWLIEQKLADKANFMEYIHNLRKGDSARDRESPETAEQTNFVKNWKVATR